jgi:hypothetical protein
METTVYSEREEGLLWGCWNCVLQSFSDGYTATEQAMCGARRQTQLCRFVCSTTIRRSQENTALWRKKRKQLEPLMLRYKLTWRDCCWREFRLFVFTEINILTKWFFKLCHSVWLITLISFSPLSFVSDVFILNVSETGSVSFIRCKGRKDRSFYQAQIVQKPYPLYLIRETDPAYEKLCKVILGKLPHRDSCLDHCNSLIVRQIQLLFSRQCFDGNKDWNVDLPLMCVTGFIISSCKGEFDALCYLVWAGKVLKTCIVLSHGYIFKGICEG